MTAARNPDAGENPGNQLPVATRPAMLARRGDVIARGKLLDNFNIRGECLPREDSLEKVVTQKRVVGNAPLQGRLENVDVVNALAAVRSFSKQILVDVGDRKRIRIDAGWA